MSVLYRFRRCTGAGPLDWPASNIPDTYDQRMTYRHAALSIFAAAAMACSDPQAPPSTDPAPPPAPVLLRDIVIPNLPSPFYHFEYDGSGRITGASYASDLLAYDV